jgi:hypothetical protein
MVLMAIVFVEAFRKWYLMLKGEVPREVFEPVAVPATATVTAAVKIRK